MGQTASALTTAKILREHYLPGIEAEFNTKTILRDRLRKTKVTPVSGRYYLYNLWATENQAVGSRAEGGTLPVASQQGYNSALFYRTNQYGRFNISGVAIDAAARGGAGSLDPLDKEMVGLRRTMSKDNNRQLFGDGSGLLARCKSAVDTGNVVINGTTYDVWTITIDCTQNDGVASRGPNANQYIRAGMTVAIQLIADGTILAGSSATTVMSVTPTTVVVVDPGGGGQASVTTTYGIYRRDASAGTWTSTAGSGTTTDSYGLISAIGATEPGWFWGTAAVTKYGTGTSGQYGDISKASNSYWQGNVLSGSANQTTHVGPGTLRPLTLDLMQQATDAAEFYEGETSLILCDQAMYRKYAALMYPDRRWKGGEMKLDGGWTGLAFGTIPVVKDVDCPPNTFLFLDESSFDILQERTLSEMAEDDIILLRDSNTDSYTGTLIYREQLGCNAPNKNAILTDIHPTL